MKGNHIFIPRAAISCLRKPRRCLTCIHINVFRCCRTCLVGAMSQKGHQCTAGMAAKLQHALRWIEFYVKFYVQGYHDTEVKEANRCTCVVAAEETRMLNLNTKDADRKLEFDLYSHFREKH